MATLIAKVYVDKTVYHIDKAFDYLVPPRLADTLSKGCRVIVPFGSSNKKQQGLVAELTTVDEANSKLKPIWEQLDTVSIMTDEMLSMANFLVRNTFCTYYEAVRTVLPIGTNVAVLQSYSLTKQLDEIELECYSEKERQLLQFLQTKRSKKELVAFLECKGNPAKLPLISVLIKQGVILETDSIKQNVTKKTIRMVRLAEGVIPSELKLSPKQKEVATKLFELQTAVVKQLCYFCGITEAVIKNLVAKRLIEYFDKEVEVQYEPATDATPELSRIELSASQAVAFSGILELINDIEPHVALLFGITGSGKTQVYIKLIEQVLQAKKTAIMLVPEIALTPQMVGKFKSLFGSAVAVIHSALSAGERLYEFNRIKNNVVSIVIGTRSAVFSPLQNIGIIIMDEEGESSYKSDKSPRYHAREVAKQRCVTHNCVLLLGSATPSVDSFYRAEIGIYKLFSIEDRFQNATLPNVYIVDMQEELARRNFSPLSEVLQQQIKMNIQQNEQSILLINRRGYNTYATCMQCGEVIMCKSCDIAMTYHKANGYLMCHYCGHTEKWTSICPICKGEFIKLTGMGTQKLEDELTTLFPEARILRMDTDTTYSRHSYEKNFEDFRIGKYDIMLGTQMIAKGLDFPNVTLVGVMNADSGLYSTDFRSSERVFSLITQVVGRSGRSEKSGRAYIQTQNVQNDVINFAASQDYKAFYHDEIKTRRLLTYPPFCDICVLGLNGADEQKTAAAANQAMSILKELSCVEITLKVLGVTPAVVPKVNNKYRYRIIMKCKFNNKFKQFLSDVLKKCAKDKLFVNISIFADINGDINI